MILIIGCLVLGNIAPIIATDGEYENTEIDPYRELDTDLQYGIENGTTMLFRNTFDYWYNGTYLIMVGNDTIYNNSDSIVYYTFVNITNIEYQTDLTIINYTTYISTIFNGTSCDDVDLTINITQPNTWNVFGVFGFNVNTSLLNIIMPQYLLPTDIEMVDVYGNDSTIGMYVPYFIIFQMMELVEDVIDLSLLLFSLTLTIELYDLVNATSFTNMTSINDTNYELLYNIDNVTTYLSKSDLGNINFTQINTIDVNLNCHNIFTDFNMNLIQNVSVYVFNLSSFGIDFDIYMNYNCELICSSLEDCPEPTTEPTSDIAQWFTDNWYWIVIGIVGGGVIIWVAYANMCNTEQGFCRTSKFLRFRG